jgi:K+-transporting ATPase A subunit
MNLSYRQRVIVMFVLLAVFMAGIAISNTVNQYLGIGICAVAFVLTALVVLGLNRGGR